MNFRYVPPSHGGDPVIRPIDGYKTDIYYVLEYPRGSAISLQLRGKSSRFDVAKSNIEDDAHRHGLNNHQDRIRGLSPGERQKLARILGVSVQDLDDIAKLEEENNIPKP